MTVPIEVDKYGNTPDRLINCCFPDCGCDGSRNCDAENGASDGALTLNRERRIGWERNE